MFSAIFQYSVIYGSFLFHPASALRFTLSVRCREKGCEGVWITHEDESHLFPSASCHLCLRFSPPRLTSWHQSLVSSRLLEVDTSFRWRNIQWVTHPPLLTNRGSRFIHDVSPRGQRSRDQDGSKSQKYIVNHKILQQQWWKVHVLYLSTHLRYLNVTWVFYFHSSSILLLTKFIELVHYFMKENIHIYAINVTCIV